MSDAQATPIFEPTIQSLGMNYTCPQWFRDAKFGIYMHWGVYSVAARHEWYGRHLYIPGHEDYAHHLATYGHPGEFGYKDLIPLWTAEKFDPDAMLDAIKRAGAKYFSPCAVHHDNFDLWDSTRIHKWNAANMGPKKDLIGMLRDATRRAGLRWGCTTHLARSCSWFNTNKNRDEQGPFDGNDPAYEDFYHAPSDDISEFHPSNPPLAWREHWKERMFDLIDRYELDLLYFDGALPFRGDDNFQSGLDVLAHYYNNSVARHGHLDSVMFLKDIDEYLGSFNHGLYVNNISSLDMEQHGASRLRYEPWQTDFSVLKYGWSYSPAAEMYPTEELIWLLVDVVSKYGNLLLNITPTPEGELEQRMVDLLAEFGSWLETNGEAIYATRPFSDYGQGDNVRFTTKGDVLNIILRHRPAEGCVRIDWPELERDPATIQAVTVLTTGEAMPFEQDDSGLTVTCPTHPQPGEKHAFILQAKASRPMSPTWLR